MSQQHHNQSSPGHHLVPIPVYVKTLLALLVLTILTVGVSYIDFGKWNFFVAFAIASVKAALVMSFFMGLYWDSKLNRAIILSSFAALALFIFFCAADLWTKTQPTPVKVVQAAVALSAEELRDLEKGSAEMVESGKKQFAQNCAVCHGAEGKGDGAGGASLNPKPRNFHAPVAEWKNGNSVKSIYVTLTYGIPGGGMGAYKTISPKDRLALAHYVRTFSDSPSATSAADAKYAQALKEDGIGGGVVKQSIPVELAIERMVK